MPPEVRNRIFELVLYEPKGVEVDLSDPIVSESHHALAQTNRQLNQECGKRLFGVNTFIFRLRYTNYLEDPDWLWEDERNGFNDFIEHHAEGLRNVRVEMRQLDHYWNNATYFFENLKPIRAGLRKLQANNTPSRLLTQLKLKRCSVSFHMNLIDRDIAEAEIEEQVRAAMEKHADPEKEVEAMQAVIGNTLFGIREDEDVDKDEDGDEMNHV